MFIYFFCLFLGTICSVDPVNAPSAACFENVFDWTTSASLDVLRSGRQQVSIIGECCYFFIYFSFFVFCVFMFVLCFVFLCLLFGLCVSEYLMFGLCAQML